jgi:hypothetical protein
VCIGLELSDPGQIPVVGFLNPSNYNLGSKNGEDFLILKRILAFKTVLQRNALSVNWSLSR